MNQKGNVATIKDIKDAAKALGDAVEEANPSGTMKLQLGILLAPMNDLNVQQVKTALNKYRQALGSFEDTTTAAMTMEWILVNEGEKTVIELAQKKLEIKKKLAGDSGNVKAATKEQAALVTADTKLQQVTSNVKS